jgi:uncharacterized membrane protein
MLVGDAPSACPQEDRMTDESLPLRLTRKLERSTALDKPVDALRPVVLAALRAQPRIAAVLHGRPIGHAAHPLTTDVPIGFWASSTVLDLVPAGGDSRRQASDLLLGLGILSAVPAAVTGLADWSVSDRRTLRVGSVHGMLNNVALGLYGTSWLLRRGGHRGLGVAVSLGAGGVLGVSAYLGGHMASRLGSPPTTASGPAEPEREGQAPGDVPV